ncbi:MAG: signal recognition particle protein Srp19 [Thermoplasmata archaeon]|nr:signal recognition particle protein Srp19 [Thermoplasmata archaeon]
MRNKLVLWPIYFDSHMPRYWRKVPKSMAVSNPSIDEIFKAAKKLGLNPVKEEKAHPARWWRKEGCILIEKKGKKAEIIKKIAEIIKEGRSEKEA